MISNSLIYFYVEKNEDFPKNLVKIYLPNKNVLPNNFQHDLNLFTYEKEKSYIFIPSRDYKKIESSGVYGFRFNYYIDNDTFYKLIPNQPIIMADNYKTIGKKEVYEKVINNIEYNSKYTEGLLSYIFD